MSATAVTAAAANFLQTRFCGFQVATAGLGPTNIAVNMAWEYANTIKTLSESFFLLRVIEKHRVYVMELMGERDIV